MATTAPCKSGDWVRFYRDGRMVIGVVQYVRRREAYCLDPWAVQTDVGEVYGGSLLEVRAGAEALPAEALEK